MKFDPLETRREIKSRNTRLAAAITKWLAARGCRPNQISLLSMVFALLAGLCFLLSQHLPTLLRDLTLLFTALCILLRLLCNLFDGMLAIEEGYKSPLGELYNDLPDRPSDVFILVGAGYAATAVTLGWIAAILAILTAYVRVLGQASGAKVTFAGPMAKQHRMAMMIAAALLAIIFSAHEAFILTVALILVIVGSVWTMIRRLKFIAKNLTLGSDHAPN